MMRSLVLFFVFCLALGSFSLFAAEVTKVKGKSALLDMKGESAAAGDQFYAIKSNGKRGAVIRIVKIKGDKAIGKVLRGKAQAGMTLEFKPKAAKGVAKSPPSDSSISGDITAGRSYWGGMVGFAMDKMDANVNDGDSNFVTRVSLSGTSFSGKGLFDYELFKQVWFRGTTGLEGFSATGEAKCGPDNDAACTAKIYYLSFDFIGRYVFMEGKYRPWLGGGIGLLFPVMKDASALDAASITTTNVILVGGGLDWFINQNMYVPIQFEYGMLPKSDEVEASWMALRVGLAIPFK